jgi:hypothetical protein
MKNNYLVGLIICLILTNCGPSANQLELQRIDDSTIMADSLAKNLTLANNIDLNTNTPSDKKFIKTAELKFKVNNVLFATESIEDITVKYGGYLTFSNLQNRNKNSKNARLSRDSILISQQIVVVNEIQLRVPNDRLDSFIRELNPLIVFFDYRVIKLSDVTLQFSLNQKKTDRLQKYEQRQSQHINNKPGKLKETTTAEDNLLERQNQVDDLQVKSMALDDQVKYCNLTIEIYQKPIIVKEVIADFDYVSDAKPNFFIRIGDSIVQGWWILEEVVLFLIKIWGIALLIISVVFGAKYLSKLYKKIK